MQDKNLGGKPPFGYRKKEFAGKIAIEKVASEAETVRRIYEHYAAGKSTTEIGEIVNMHSQKVHRILFEYQPTYTTGGNFERSSVIIPPELAATVNQKRIGRGGSRSRKSTATGIDKADLRGALWMMDALKMIPENDEAFVHGAIKELKRFLTDLQGA